MQASFYFKPPHSNLRAFRVQASGLLDKRGKKTPSRGPAAQKLKSKKDTFFPKSVKKKSNSLIFIVLCTCVERIMLLPVMHAGAQDPAEEDTLPMDFPEGENLGACSHTQVAESKGHYEGAEGGEEENPQEWDEEVVPVLDHEQSPEVEPEVPAEPPAEAMDADDPNLASDDGGKKGAFQVRLQHTGFNVHVRGCARCFPG